MNHLYRYLPQDRLHALLQGAPLPERAYGAALFADISGFTPLFAALAERLGPQRAAEEMARVLGKVYDSLVFQVEQQRGSIIDFVGDAIICWFEERDPFSSPGSLRAATAALAMQRAMVPFADLEILPGVRLALAVKISIAAGATRRFVVGDPAIRQLDVLTGTPLQAMAQAERLARSGEIVLAPAARSTLQGCATLAETRIHPGTGTEFAVLTALATSAPPDPWPAVDTRALTTVQLRPWAPPALSARLRQDDGEVQSELRPIVALFVRFSGIDYDRDPGAGAALDAFVRWVQRTVEHCAGDLLQVTIGDKGSNVHVAFGLTEAHDDAAARAVHAAEALLALPGALRFLRLQIGIASGPARTGTYGSGTRRAYGAIGSDVVLASRLMTAAPPGEMRCSYSVFHQARNKVAFESLPSVRVKGRAGLIRVYRPAQETPPPSVATPAMVGRSAEIAVLDRVLDEVQDGMSRVLLIEGEAGIGKSHLVEMLKDAARERGLSGLSGNGQSIEQQTPYRAWRDVFNDYFNLEATQDVETRRARVAALAPQLIPEHAARLPVLNDILELDLPETDLTQGLDASLRQQNVTLVATALLRAWTQEHPLVLVLDDVHWLDELSWQLALQLIRTLSIQGGSCLCVLASRPLEENSLGDQVFSELRAMPLTRAVTLSALAPEDIRALLADRLQVPSPELPAPLVTLVQTRANGNPFFAQELVFHLRDTGVIQIDAGSETAPAACHIRGDFWAAEHALPDTLHGLILARLDRQPPERQFILKVAAVLGRTFTYAPLRYLLNHYTLISEPILQAHLNALQNADFTFLETRDPELTYMFKHIITQEAAYQTLLFAQRRDLHRTAAEWYELRAEVQSHWPLLAYHYRYAEDVEKERHYLNLAGQAAQKMFANDAAFGFYTRLLTLLDGDIGPDGVEVYLRRGEVLELIGRWDEAEADYRAALALSEERPTLQFMARCQNALGELFRQRGDYAEAQAWFQRAQSSWEALQDVSGRARALVGQGGVARSQGNYPLARAYLETSKRLAQEVHDRLALAEAYKHLAWLDTWEGNLPEAQAGYQVALALARELGDRVLIANGLNNLASALDIKSKLETIQALIVESLAIRQEIGDKAGIANSLYNLGAVFFYSDLGSAQVYFEKSIALMRELGDKAGLVYVLLGLANTLINQERVSHAAACLQEAAALLHETGNKRHIAYLLRQLGLLHSLQGDYAGAQTHFRESIDVYRELGHQTDALHSTCNLALALTAQCEWRAARALYQESLSSARMPDTAIFLVHILVGLIGILLCFGMEAVVARFSAVVGAWLASAPAPLEIFVRRSHERYLDRARAALSPADFEAAWAQGVALPIDRAVDEALALAERLS